MVEPLRARAIPDENAEEDADDEPIVETAASPFANVRPRRSVDEALKSMQSALVVYTGQADLKANIVITTSSLVLTIVATRWSENSLRPGLAAVAMGALFALISAITVVMPKFRLPRKDEARELHDHENPLFFGHFVSLGRERFVEVMGEMAMDDATLYELQTADIYDQGKYLIEKKYRHLRAAYVFLALAFVAGAVVQGIAVAV